jgi:hypothetical protein
MTACATLFNTVREALLEAGTTAYAVFTVIHAEAYVESFSTNVAYSPDLGGVLAFGGPISFTTYELTAGDPLQAASTKNNSWLVVIEENGTVTVYWVGLAIPGRHNYSFVADCALASGMLVGVATIPRDRARRGPADVAVVTIAFKTERLV